MSADAEGRTPGGDERPVPDPTTLTTQQLERSIRAERDYVDGQIEVLRERLAGIDKATELRLSGIVEIPSQIDEKVRSLRTVVDEKFLSIAKQFQERDTRSERESRDNKVAVDAAFAAQKEAACMAANEQVLCADLVWRPAGDLLVGDELIALDEETAPGSYSRCYRRATVTANALERDALLLVNTPMGSVRCTYDHPWLVRRHRGHAWEWRKAEDLRPGDVLVKMLDAWEVDRSWEGGWFAGILDGEGCLTFKSKNNNDARFSIGQVAGPIADRIDEALKMRVEGVGVLTRGARGNAQAQTRWQIDRRAEIMKLLGSVRPYRLLEHADEVWEGFSIKSTKLGRMTAVTSVEGAGTGMVARLSTSTHTYIGAGFAMHNSEQNKSNTLAIDKSERATAETLNKQADLFKSTTDALAANLSDAKSRLERLESIKQGGKEAYAALYVVAALIAVILGIGVTLGIVKK